MNTPEYLSPSALAVWERDNEEYFLRYLADKRPPRPAQTQPMSVGSAFDAYIKAYLYDIINGEGSSAGTDFEFMTLFENQVEEQNRDFALPAGKICFEAYQTSGILPDLVAILEDGSDHKFEVKLQEPITLENKVVTLHGRPDLTFKSACDRPVILDWKVNGYCSKSGVSPNKGYILCKDGWTPATSRTHGTFHKECFRSEICTGLWYNSAYPFEDFAKQWADQLATYLWLCDEPVGSDALVIIHQLAWRNGQCRIADIRGVLSEDFQIDLFNRYAKLWHAVHTGVEGYISLDRIDRLSAIAAQSAEAAESTDGGEKLFIEMTRKA